MRITQIDERRLDKLIDEVVDRKLSKPPYVREDGTPTALLRGLAGCVPPRPTSPRRKKRDA